MMTGLGCLTFLLIAFGCYSVSLSKPNRNEGTNNKKVDMPHEQQHHPIQSEATYETRQKRSQLEFGDSSSGTLANLVNAGNYKGLGELIEDTSDNAIVPAPQESEFENMPPLMYFMLLQKLKQLQNNERQLSTRRTPRLGRSIDFQLFDAGTGNSAGHDFDDALNMANDYAISRQFLPRLMKKSVQFKPRLGKRTQVCN